MSKNFIIKCIREAAEELGRCICDVNTTSDQLNASI